MNAANPPPEIAYCFESSEGAALQRALVPGHAHLFFSWEDLVERLSGTAPQSGPERLLTLESILTPDERPTRGWLSTLELLREALVLSHQDVDYLFQTLPATPRNVRLNEVFHLYLDSRAGEDWTMRAWNAVERIRERESADGLPPLVFVRGPDASILFYELATRYARLFAEGAGVSIKETWEFLTPTKPVAVRAGESPHVLERLARVANRRARRGLETLVAFAGSWAEQTYLECLFAREANTRTRILPFTAFAHIPESVQLLAYAGKALFELDPRELLLSGPELDTLARAGFPVQSERARLERRRARYRGMALSSTPVFSSIHESQDGVSPRNVRLGMRRAPRRPVVDTMQAQIGRRRLSATQLELYSDCPSRHFFQSGLKLQKTLPGEDASYAWVFGQAAHLALERYFESAPDTVETDALVQLFDRAAKDTVPDLDVRTSLRVSMQEHFRKIAVEVPRLENELTEIFGPHKPVFFEHKFEVKLGDVDLSGMMDRVDRLADGSLLILDYKTGSVDFTPNHISDGSNFQALLYTIAAESFGEAPWGGLLFYDLKQFEVRRGLVKDFAIRPDAKAKITRGHLLKEEKLESIREQGRAHIQRIGSSITAGNFTATASRASCERCDFPQLCRNAWDHE